MRGISSLSLLALSLRIFLFNLVERPFSPFKVKSHVTLIHLLTSPMKLVKLRIFLPKNLAFSWLDAYECFMTISSSLVYDIDAEVYSGSIAPVLQRCQGSSLFHEYFEQDPIQRTWCSIYFGWPNQPSSAFFSLYLYRLLFKIFTVSTLNYVNQIKQVDATYYYKNRHVIVFFVMINSCRISSFRMKKWKSNDVVTSQYEILTDPFWMKNTYAVSGKRTRVPWITCQVC